MPKIFKNGKLVEVTEEEARSLANLAEDQGLPGTPISPKAAAGLGATEDQIKMAGTKSQKTEALRLDVAPEETLTQERRLQKSRQELTTQEQLAEQKAEKLRRLGSLESRVDTLISEQFSQQAEGAARLTAQIEELPEEQQQEFNLALEDYQAALSLF